MEKTNSIKLNNNTEIPLCGLGTYAINDSQTYYEAVKQGVRLFDTAHFYGNEKEVGEGLKKARDEGLVKREELYILTKIWPSHYDRVEETLKEQLKMLQVDYVDMYLLHWPMRIWDNEKKEYQKIPTHKLWAVMETMVKKGLTKSIGVSNFGVQMLLDMLTYCEIKPAVNEFELHPYLQRTDLVNFCKKFDIHVIAYGSLCLGRYVISKEISKKYTLLEEKIVKELAEKYKTSEACIVLNWTINRGITVIPKSSNPDRISKNLSCVSFKMSDEDYKKFDSLEANMAFCTDACFWDEFGNINIFA